MSKITCCYQCNERTLGCHSICEKYITESKENRKRLQEQWNDRQIKNVITGLHDNRINTERPGRKRIDYK